MIPVSLSKLVARLRTPVVSGKRSFPGLEVELKNCDTLDQDSMLLTGVAIDSRHVQDGFVFAAFQGDHCHGIDHADSAIQAGARLVICEPGAAKEQRFPILEVTDLSQALQHLAIATQSSEENQLQTVAVTGSVGKTTTCHLGSRFCSDSFSTHSPRNSFNNFLGVPVTILEAPAETEVLWLEMGTNQPGEISGLSAIGRPDIAVVTAVGATHLEGLGSIEGVFREKFSIFEQDDVRLAIAPVEYRDSNFSKPCWWTGPGGDVEVMVDPSKAGRFRVEHRPLGHSFEIEAPLAGTGALRCLESALAATLELGVSVDKICQISPHLDFPGLRQEKHSVGGIELIFDCYNASPPSVNAAVRDLAASTGKRTVAILGTMEELGRTEADYHFEIGKLCAEAGIDMLWCCGRGAEWLKNGSRSAGGEAETLPSGEVGLRELESFLKVGDRVLFKASRKEALEKLASQLKANLQKKISSASSGGGSR